MASPGTVPSMSYLLWLPQQLCSMAPSCADRGLLTFWTNQKKFYRCKVTLVNYELVDGQQLQTRKFQSLLETPRPNMTTNWSGMEM